MDTSESSLLLFKCLNWRENITAINGCFEQTIAFIKKWFILKGSDIKRYYKMCQIDSNK